MKAGKCRNVGMVIGVLLLIGAMLVVGACAAGSAPQASPAPQGQATAAPQGIATQAQPTTVAPQGQTSGAQRDYILIGRPNPTTGPLAGFGEGSPWAEDRALAAINKDGGIFIKELNKKLPVKIKVVDTESNPTKAAEVAAKLILEDKVDVMLVEHTPDTVNPVSATCERYQVPCISLDAPVEAWLTGGPYKWSYHAFWTVDTISDVYIDIWEQAQAKDPTINKAVGYLFPNDPDGKSWSEVFNKKLTAKGYKVVDTGRFPYGTKDFSAMINSFKGQKVDIVTGTLPPPDFATAWRQMHQQGFVPKVATIGKAVLFPADAAALGENLAQGVTAEIWWSPSHPFKSSLTGETSKELCDAWTKESKKQWSQPIGYKYAGIEIVADVLKRAQSLDKNKIREATEQTELDTMVGHIKYNDKHYSETPLVGGQWTKGKEWPWEILIVSNTKAPAIPKQAELIVPLPK